MIVLQLKNTNLYQAARTNLQIYTLHFSNFTLYVFIKTILKLISFGEIHKIQRKST